jgi:hypothetical protein
MAGAFDGLLSDSGSWSYEDPSSYRQADISPEDLQRMMRQWGAEQANGRSRIDGFGLARAMTHGGQMGDAQDQVPEEIAGSGVISRYLNDGTDYYDQWGEDGKYLGRTRDESSSINFRNFLIAAGAMYGGGLAFEGATAGAGGAAASAGAGSAAGMTASEQIAMLAANGMSDAAIAASFPELAAAGGLTGVGGGAAAVTGGANWLDSAKNGLQTVGDGLKSVGISGGDLLRTGAAFALSKDVETKADPSVTAAINGLKTTTDAANARAQSNDEYWRTTFAPRYLQAMDDQISMGRQLNDFNMGLAKKYDSRYWNTTARQQDAFYDQVNNYDTDAARARIAGEAGANADMQNAAAMQALVRDLNRRGLNPNSGLVMSNMRQQAQQGALQKTMAMNMAREAARKEGLNMRAVAAGLGGNLTGASAGFAGQAGQSAGLGMNGINNANQGFNSNVGNWNATTGLGLSGLNSLGNLGMGLTTGNNRANELNTLGFNQMLGYGLGMFGSGKGG